MKALLQTNFSDLVLYARGKVRDIYLAGEHLLLVATDRISAFDHVLGSGIPDKGKILTQMSLFWFDFLEEIVPNHLISARVEDYPEAMQPYREQLEGRSMLVKRAQMFPVECVVRGYLAGSGWKDYLATGKVCGIPIAPGLREGEELPEPIFTPASKSLHGKHDENISFDHMIELVGAEDAERLRALSLAIYRRAAEHANDQGLLLADTKFEFGTTAEGIVLADEVLTPDSSRYWDREGYRPGQAQPSFDKQFVRDYLESIHWNKQAPAPALPDDVVEQTRRKYLQAFEALAVKGKAVQTVNR
ncbi:phosphoribosylaminoimidazolesuccinocarboxamide synthase [Paracidobacterium acidisoli]|uniref:Phosphoribosylaminoimidazole-succinocarboxamide synthase n=1 Tax=Paracidobacterium acidisoli TaxID=2303751 RepID=A0A372IU23_9BACT|nr:phosphoribosylaminoimidazolesuccinocarboxamide synthase [Paracidobacterium acidisoli]MBT9329855.1 phosphoribosylaminoimidazolesuccinocarboxamide synthase [Paracidobacterium acidisoli]